MIHDNVDQAKKKGAGCPSQNRQATQEQQQEQIREEF